MKGYIPLILKGTWCKVMTNSERERVIRALKEANIKNYDNIEVFYNTYTNMYEIEVDDKTIEVKRDNERS